jgi:hypothetical protein
MFGIRVIFGYRAISPEKWIFSDRRSLPLNSCKNHVLRYRLADSFSDTYLCTSQGAWRVISNVDNNVSGCFSCA